MARVHVALREPVRPIGPAPASSSLEVALDELEYAARRHAQRHVAAELRLVFAAAS